MEPDSGDSNLRVEVSHLRRALDALRGGDTNGALNLCQSDAILFANGQFAPEREIISIEALLRLGRIEEAKARTKKFREDYPSLDLPVTITEIVRAP